MPCAVSAALYVRCDSSTRQWTVSVEAPQVVVVVESKGKDAEGGLGLGNGNASLERTPGG